MTWPLCEIVLFRVDVGGGIALRHNAAPSFKQSGGHEAEDDYR
jgi:hypothetical protein